MKKKSLLMGVLAATQTIPSCGNKDMFDTVYPYDRAIIRLPDDTIVEGDLYSWTDYSDGDQIQVTVNGKTYLVHSYDITLIAECCKELLVHNLIVIKLLYRFRECNLVKLAKLHSLLFAYTKFR